MERLFRRHEIRRQYSLDGLWNFRTMPEGKVEPMNVPGCWESHPSYSSYRGLAQYHRSVTIPEAGWYRFIFHGVSHTAKVSIDGEALCSHYNAYTAFDAVKWLEAGEHNLQVDVDNRFHEKSVLHFSNDYYTYGGLIRPVMMERVAGSFLRNLRFISRQAEGGWQCEITAELEHPDDASATLEVEIELAGKQCRVAVPGNGPVSLPLDYPEVDPWSPESPVLYSLAATLYQEGVPVDDLIERVGFREVKAAGEQILLNGSPIRLRGFNRHEDAPIFGCSIPVPLMKHDLDLVKAMGGNYIRTSHYPNDQRFLDLCDECGILVWEEHHSRGMDLPRMLSPYFDEQCENCNAEMVEQHFNHPSIILWGVLNECISNHPEGAEKYRKQLAQIRSLDSSRLLTFASDKHCTDLCFEYVDVYSFNLYAGWYEKKPIDQFYTEVRDYARQHGGGKKPVIISEFGAGGIYGERSLEGQRWTEESQREILEGNLRYYLAQPEIAGLTIWQFMDCRVCEEGWFERRPGTRNNKGMLDRYRRPKLAFHMVRELYKEDAR